MLSGREVVNITATLGIGNNPLEWLSKTKMASLSTRMNNKSIQPTRNRDYQITPRTRPRGLWGQTWTVVLQPGYFFRTLPQVADTRSWLWAAILVLALTGLSAIRQDALTNATSGGGGNPTPDFSGAPPGTDISGGGGGVIQGGGGFEVAPVGVPGDAGGVPSSPGDSSTSDVTSTWTIALVTGAGIILGWIVLSILLSEVTLFNGHAPTLGHNFQIAIWASIPLAIMALLQLVYYAAGGISRGKWIIRPAAGLGSLPGYVALPAKSGRIAYLPPDTVLAVEFNSDLYRGA